MERYLRLVVAGGPATVAGLWVAETVPTGSGSWIAGVAVALTGAVVMLAGVASEIER